MLSLISILALGLFYPCFALPILPGQSLDSTDSSITDDIAKEDTLNLRLLMNDQTSPSTSISEETTIEYSTSEPLHKKRDHHHLSITTIQSVPTSPAKREDKNIVLSTTTQSMHLFSSSSKSSSDKREDIDDDPFTTVEFTTEIDRSEFPTETEKFTNKKSSRYSSKKAKEDNFEDAHIPTAVFDDKALDKIPNVPNDFLILDENPNFIVTDLPERSTTMVYREKEALNQGQKSSHFEEEESDH